MKTARLMAASCAVALLATACGADTADVDDAAESVAEEASDVADDASSMAEDAESMADEAMGDGEPLTFGFVPSREADQLVDSADALAEVLSEATGVEVESFVSQDYAALTEAMASGQAQIGAFGPAGVVRAIDEANAEFVLQTSRFGAFTYHGQYMTNDPDTYCLDEVVTVTDEESGVDYLYCNGTAPDDDGSPLIGPAGEDAIAMIDADTTVAFVEPDSTSGYVFPVLQMEALGVDTSGMDLFAGGHDAAVQAVYDGDAEVGLSFDDARTALAAQFPDVGTEVVVFGATSEIPNDGFVVSQDLDDATQQAIVEALLAFAETEEGATVLDDLYEISGLREADAAELDIVRDAMGELPDAFG